MPDDIRIGIYAVASGILAIISAVKYGEGDTTTAILTTVTAGTSLLSAVMTWRQRRWRIENASREDAGGLGS